MTDGPLGPIYETLAELRATATEQRAALARFREDWAATHESSHLIAQDATGRPIYSEMLAAHGHVLAAIAALETEATR